ncbi:MAG: glycine--tRNA ligase subunit beta [Desulfovibrio sp.]|nr:glycine--tRNA ligase subunit beta [Desulfovibrio sp.]
MATFVLEIGSEELPSRFLDPEEKALQSLFSSALNEASLEYGGIDVMCTPRRAVTVIKALSPVQTTREEIVSGPPVRVAYDDSGMPTKALKGFAQNNACTLEDIFRVQTEKGTYVAVRKHIGGESAVKLLADICPRLIAALPFGKRMRWGTHTLAYARPLRWILALVDDQVVPFTLGPITSGRSTYGHRIHGPGPFTVNHAEDFLPLLAEQGGIVLDAAERRRMIVNNGDTLAQQIGGRIIWEDALLAEVQGLTEHPVPLLGDFDEAYLEVPREVLLTSMETHQKSFGIENADGKLLPHFLTVLNLTPERMDVVKRGWERVLRARLEDARFFWYADLKENIDHWLDKLDAVIFISGLGSMGDKSRRLERLCLWLADTCDSRLSADAARAGRLSKADLVSAMVGEFDTLQGIMGGIYAARKGESESVARALREQYLPAGPDSPLPESPLGALLSIADKADTLAGCFGMGMIPTGAADPNGLRRCALGIIRNILGFALDLDVREVFLQAQKLYGDRDWKLPPQDALQKLMEFFAARLRHYFLSKGHDTLLVEAVLGTDSRDVRDCNARLDALATFSKLPDYEAVVRTFKRVANILRKQAQKELVPDHWDASLLREDAEKHLASTLDTVLPALDFLWNSHEHVAALNKLAELRPTVDTFFDKVMVMAEEADLRCNRLSMLRQLGNRFARLADFSALQM